MIAYFPELYPDELFYSTVARYYSHLYPSYNMAIKKLCINKNSRIDIEFGLKALNKETRSFFEIIQCFFSMQCLKQMIVECKRKRYY